jgi:hypothetical protein
MGGQLQPGEAAAERAGFEGVFVVLAENAKLIRVFLEDLEHASRNLSVGVYLHDEIATAEELERMIKNIKIHELTEEELADRE